MSRRVLVADDSATIQKVIKIAFSRHELEIVEAASLIESLAAVNRSPVDALILDASLPGARGPDDFAKLRAEANDIPVLLLVGTYDSIDESSFRKAGFSHFLKKPFESSDIVATLDTLLGGGPEGEPELTPPPPHGRPQHPTMIMTGGAFDPTRTAPEGASGSFRLAVDDDEDAPSQPPPPPPMLDQARKGRRAFGELEDTAKTRAGALSDEATDPRRTVPGSPVGKGQNPLPPIPPATGQTFAVSPEGGSAQDRSHRAEVFASQSGPELEGALPALVRQAVEDYCERHFKSLAREVIASELRRLADEKARHLVDN